MKLSVIALDYDGTIARGDVLDPSVREAIAVARRESWSCSSPGESSTNCARVAGDLRFVDGVIADTALEIPNAVRGRYDLAEDELENKGR